MEISMTKYQQTANPNATNSELDAKQIVSTTIPDCDLPVSLTEGQISTILYIMEGYIQGNDDYDEDSVFYQDVNNIFQRLETVVDSHYDRLEELCKEK